MLFRQFLWITVSAALMGVTLSYLIQATYPTKQRFSSAKRLHQWEMHDAKQACEADDRLCGLHFVFGDKV